MHLKYVNRMCKCGVTLLNIGRPRGPLGAGGRHQVRLCAAHIDSSWRPRH